MGTEGVIRTSARLSHRLSATSNASTHSTHSLKSAANTATNPPGTPSTTTNAITLPVPVSTSSVVKKAPPIAIQETVPEEDFDDLESVSSLGAWANTSTPSGTNPLHEEKMTKNMLTKHTKNTTNLQQRSLPNVYAGVVVKTSKSPTPVAGSTPTSTGFYTPVGSLGATGGGNFPEHNSFLDDSSSERSSFYNNGRSNSMNSLSSTASKQKKRGGTSIWTGWFGGNK